MRYVDTFTRLTKTATDFIWMRFMSPTHKKYPDYNITARLPERLSYKRVSMNKIQTVEHRVINVLSGFWIIPS